MHVREEQVGFVVVENLTRVDDEEQLPGTHVLPLPCFTFYAASMFEVLAFVLQQKETQQAQLIIDLAIGARVKAVPLERKRQMEAERTQRRLQRSPLPARYHSHYKPGTRDHQVAAAFFAPLYPEAPVADAPPREVAVPCHSGPVWLPETAMTNRWACLPHAINVLLGAPVFRTPQALSEVVRMNTKKRSEAERLQGFVDQEGLTLPPHLVLHV